MRRAVDMGRKSNPICPVSQWERKLRGLGESQSFQESAIIRLFGVGRGQEFAHEKTEPNR